MRKAVVLTVLAIGLIGAVGFAQCGCEQHPVASGGKEPTCYTSFWSGEEIHFKLIVPAEYFFTSPTPPTPLITGWRVEQLDGTVVFQDLFPDAPKGAWYEMVWNQRDLSCARVSPGYYRIVISTDSAGVYSAIIKIVSPPPCLVPCGMHPVLPSCPCTVPCGKPYIKFIPQEIHAGISLTISIKLCGSCP